MQRSKNDRNSITASARASSVGGIVKPSALTALRFMTKLNFSGCSDWRVDADVHHLWHVHAPIANDPEPLQIPVRVCNKVDGYVKAQPASETRAAELSFVASCLYPAHQIKKGATDPLFIATEALKAVDEA